MQLWRSSPNIYVNGDAYLEGFWGLSWFPSAKAKQQREWYEAWCIHRLSTLLHKYTSYWVLREIFRHPNSTVTLEPLRKSDSAPPKDIPENWIDPMDLKCKAKADPKDETRATRRGEQVGADIKKVGTGQGSDVVLKINPWQYHEVGGPCPVAPGRGGDEILLHELMHCLSIIAGTLANTMAGPMDFTNLEEFTAIVVANVYSSETQRPLRRDHGGFELLKPALSTSQAFYDKYREYMQLVCRNHPGLAAKLKLATGIPFNPFALCS